MKILVSEIQWDTHVEDIGEMSAEKIAKLERSIARLPDKIIVELEDDCADNEYDDIMLLAIDKVSDRTGWLVLSSSMEMLRDRMPPGFDVDAFNRFCSR